MLESSISQTSTWRREEVRFMNEILVHIMTTVISGCLVTLFGYWLHKRDKK
uniref:Type I toxin-antitoxin system Fst family toxin n=2 Tax=Staphylococcus aureus TaxID=1280 RepID=A1KWW8_STAAU|nr:unnamed protein product [Staphylococcus aureus]